MDCQVSWLDVQEPRLVGKEPIEFGQIGETVTCLACHPDRDRIVVGTASGKLVVWDPVSCAMVCSLQAHTREITRITFMPNGSEFVTAAVDGFVHFWNAKQYERQKGFSVGSPLYTAALSPDGERLAAGGEDMKLRIWWTRTGLSHASLVGHEEPTTACTWVNNEVVVSAGGAGHMRAWDIDKRTTYRLWQGHAQHIAHLMRLPAAEGYLSASWDRTIKVWSAYHRERFGFPAANQPVTGIGIAPKTGHVAASYWDGTVRLYDMSTSAEIDQFHAHDSALVGCAYLPQSGILVTVAQSGQLRGWSLEQMGMTQYVNQHAGEVYSAIYTPDNLRIVTGGQDSSVRVWDRAQRAEEAALETSDRFVLAVAASPDHRYYAAGTSSGTIKLWHAERLELELEIAAHDEAVSALAFTPSGTHLLSGSWDYKIKLWDLETQTCERYFDGHAGEIADLAVSADGRYLVSASWDMTGRLWDMIKTKQRDVGMELRSLEGHRERAFCCDFSPDGRRVVTGSGDGTLRMWRVDESSGAMLLEGHEGGVSCARFSPDGRLLLSGDRSGKLVLWNGLTGEALITSKHSKPILTVAISPDGRQGIVGDERGHVRLLDLQYDQGPPWVAATCTLKQPPLWRRGGPLVEHYEVACIYCGTVTKIKEKELGGAFRCPQCRAALQVCPRSLPPVRGD